MPGEDHEEEEGEHDESCDCGCGCGHDSGSGSGDGVHVSEKFDSETDWVGTLYERSGWVVRVVDNPETGEIENRWLPEGMVDGIDNSHTPPVEEDWDQEFREKGLSDDQVMHFDVSGDGIPDLTLSTTDKRANLYLKGLKPEDLSEFVSTMLDAAELQAEMQHHEQAYLRAQSGMRTFFGSIRQDRLRDYQENRLAYLYAEAEWNRLSEAYEAAGFGDLRVEGNSVGINDDAQPARWRRGSGLSAAALAYQAAIWTENGGGALQSTWDELWFFPAGAIRVASEARSPGQRPARRRWRRRADSSLPRTRRRSSVSRKPRHWCRRPRYSLVSGAKRGWPMTCVISLHFPQLS
jgi:hypothetical protein